MDKNVIISIRGSQSDGGEDQVIELVTEGSLTWEGEGSYTLRYQESELTGLEGTTTAIRAEGPQVTILRTGRYQSQMVFQEGQRHFSVYATPYGTLSMGVHTRRLRSALGEHGGEIEIDYTLELEHTVTGRNSFRIQVRERDEQVQTEDTRCLP